MFMFVGHVCWCAMSQATLRLHGQMMEVGFTPDAITYTLLIKASLDVPHA